jgi:hypothetical protein
MAAALVVVVAATEAPAVAAATAVADPVDGVRLAEAVVADHLAQLAELVQ